MGAGFLLFRWHHSDLRDCSYFLVQGRRLFGVGWRPRVGRAGTEGWVIWRPTSRKSKRALLGNEERFQLSAPEGNFFRRGVKQHIAIGGGVTVGTHAVENRDQVNFIQN